jgi:GTP-binding protein
MLRINKSVFSISAVLPDQYPKEQLPEIALAGRSNVGKSSLINTLINRRGLARTSSQPGKTQTINFYLINDAWYFVDLPGYGYARVSRVTRENWGKMIDRYLKGRMVLKEIWQLVDIRHPPTALDRQMLEWLNYQNYPRLLIATKADKISKSQRVKNLKTLK